MTSLALFLLLAAAAGHSVDTPSAQTLAKGLYLRVSTHSGPLPLELSLVGELRGIDLDTIRSCTIRVDRKYLIAPGIELNERAAHPCMANDRGLDPSFKRTLTLTGLGDYELRIVIEEKEGRQIAGMTHEVKVYIPLRVVLPARSESRRTQPNNPASMTIAP